MNTPFSQPNLANFIKTGTDAAVSKVSFPDGTSQTTAAVAGLPGFTPVLHTGRWDSNSDQLGTRAIIPDDVVENEGITPGNGTQDIPYGVSKPNDNGSLFKVSEEMAGIYTFTVQVNATAYSANYDHGPTVTFSKFLLGRAVGSNRINILNPSNKDGATSQTQIYSFIFSATTRLEPEEQMEYKWGDSFFLQGGNASNPGGWFSITKISS